LSHDRDACAAALEHGLAARAVRFLSGRGLDLWEGLLHAIKVTLSCSWSMLLQVVALSRPLLRLYRTAEGLSSGQLVSKVKVRVAAGKAHTLLLETTFRGKPGVAFDARKWFEGLMSNPTIRAAIMIPGLCLLVALSLDAYYNFGHFDEKEAVEHVLKHAEVSTPVRPAPRPGPLARVRARFPRLLAAAGCRACALALFLLYIPPGIAMVHLPSSARWFLVQRRKRCTPRPCVAGPCSVAAV